MAVLLVLALVATWVTSSELQRAREAVREQVMAPARSAALILSVGREAARLRADALELLTEITTAGPDPSGAHAASRGRLAAEVDRLEGLLDEADTGQWRELRRLVTVVDASAEAALGMIREGDAGGAEAMLDTCVVAATDLQRHIDLLAQANQQRSERRLAAADERLAAAVRLIVLAGTVLALGISMVFAVLARRLARSRRAITFHVGRVERANRDLEAFAGRISHDLRNVFAPISTASAVLAHADRDQVLVVAQQLAGCTRRATQILDGLLAFSSAGRPDPGARAHVDSVLREVLEDMQHRIAAVGAVVETDVEDVEVALSPGLLHVVLQNVVGNAVKFLAERRERRVRIAARCTANRCVLSVSDTGPGIPAEEMTRIFEPFHRGRTAKAPGMGIGLATVRRIVEAHGGRVRVVSRVGEGSTFEIELPLAVEAVRAPAEQR